MSVGAKVLMISGNRENRDRDRRDYGMESMHPGFRSEYGNYPRSDYDRMEMNYGNTETRFRDRRGREHYDNGRFSPMRSSMDDMEGNYEVDSRRYPRRENGRFAPRSEYGSGGESHYYPFGPVPPVYERGNDMNRIGFSMDGNREFNHDYTTNAAYSNMDEMDYRTSSPVMGGAKTGNTKLTEEMAEEWMHGLHNEDGTKGAHWTKEQTKQVMNQKGIKMDPLEFWVIMNALYADYCSVLKKHSVNTIDFYVDMACAWLNDKDAQEGKTARYFQYITK